jgi:hypothetical protein
MPQGKQPCLTRCPLPPEGEGAKGGRPIKNDVQTFLFQALFAEGVSARRAGPARGQIGAAGPGVASRGCRGTARPFRTVFRKSGNGWKWLILSRYDDSEVASGVAEKSMEARRAAVAAHAELLGKS